jgi:hypothetical protein
VSNLLRERRNLMNPCSWLRNPIGLSVVFFFPWRRK